MPPGVAMVTRAPSRLARARRLRAAAKVELMRRRTASPPFGLPTALAIARKSRTIALKCAPLGYGFVSRTRAILRSDLRFRPPR